MTWDKDIPSGPGPTDYDTWNVYGGSQHLRYIPGGVFGTSAVHSKPRSFCGDSARSLEFSSANIGRAKDIISKRAPGAVPWGKSSQSIRTEQNLSAPFSDSAHCPPALARRCTCACSYLLNQCLGNDSKTLSSKLLLCSFKTIQTMPSCSLCYVQPQTTSCGTASAVHSSPYIQVQINTGARKTRKS